MNVKHCGRCGQDKPRKDFANDRNGKVGLTSWCRACSKAYRIENLETLKRYQKDYYSKHREEIIARNKRYASAHRERVLELARLRSRRLRGTEPYKMVLKKAKLKYKYGLSLFAFESMKIAQLGLCAICRKPLSLVVDHDHATQAIRGLLCINCNTGLGRFLDDPGLLLRAAAYLMRNRQKGVA